MAKLTINGEFRSSSICLKLFYMILNCLFFFLQKWMFSMSCARLEHLQCLKLTIKTLCINPIWLIFIRHHLILEKERKIRLITWKKSTQRVIQNQVEHQRWSFFAKFVNGLKPFSIFVKKLHRRCSTGF